MTGEAEMPAECFMHDKIIHKLFVERECLTIPRFTYIMMETLKRPRTYILHGMANTVGSTDGVSQGVVDACLRRMTKFSVLVSAVLAAEFPTFHIMSAFRVFSLSQNKRSAAGHGSAAKADLREDRCACLQRLAQCIDIDPKTLIMEYEVFLPYAEQYYMSHSCPTREAWAAALKSLTRTRTQAGRCLCAVLVQYAAW